MTEHELWLQSESYDILTYKDLPRQTIANQNPPGWDLNAPKIKASWDTTLDKLCSLDTRSTNISQAPPRLPWAKYLLIFAAVSGSKLIISKSHVLWWLHSPSKVGKSNRRLATHTESVSVNEMYDDNACLGSVVPRRDSGLDWQVCERFLCCISWSCLRR